MTESKIELPTASADGKRNAFYHQCAIVGQKRPYAACLARSEGRLTNDEECNGAARRKDCPAIAMREKELLEGKAIYFIERTKFGTLVETLRNWIAPDPKPAASGTKKSGLADAVGGASYADLVTKMAERERSKGSEPTEARAPDATPSKPVPASFVKLAIKPGESPLEAARRRAQLSVKG